MSAIYTTKFVTDRKLTNETSLEELSQNSPGILELLTIGAPKVDKEKRHQAHNHLQKGYKFSKEQAFALIPRERVGRSKNSVFSKEEGLEDEKADVCQVSDSSSGETIKETAQRIVKDDLSERDVKAISRTLIAPDPVVTLSHLFRLQKELRALNTSEKIISATKHPEITRESNKIQKERSEQRENEGIDFLDHFSLESVIERLNGGTQDNPQMFKSLEKDEERARQLLTWIQKAISSRQLKDPGKPGSVYLSSFLKKDEFLPESGKPLLPSSLCKLGSVFASVVHGPKNSSKVITFASEALRHSPDNHASPSKRYTIVNMRKRGEPYNQARPFSIYDEN
ncbi:hypothetical protein RhiirA1_389800 [Rhizophagus irregularis]|uniref:Uncharacterized protein n=1 Tax=Rhizophagus irregularis TaxID=588596 RepID=A0A2N0SA06_9GLOM|nr:hypothetical protein RhiirA1_389800 [Rhizophagus irregularis]